MGAESRLPDLDDASLQWLESLQPSELTPEVCKAWRSALGNFADGSAVHISPRLRAKLAQMDANALADETPQARPQNGSASAVGGKEQRLPTALAAGDALEEAAVRALVQSYRRSGHLAARLDPLGLAPSSRPAELELAQHGLDGVSPDRKIRLEDFGSGKEMTFGELVRRLEQTYCGSIGVEADLRDTDADAATRKAWLFTRLERREEFAPGLEERRQLLQRLVAASGLERHLARNYPGAKRFGLEGGEGLIPLLDRLIDTAAGQGARELCIGMAHRGRLNVLVNVFGKPPEELFAEFEGKVQPSAASGDVKYHQGFSSRLMLNSEQPIHLSLAFNPSHLEVVAPVVAGSVRARQERRGTNGSAEVAAILLHGDASFSGQGVVMETLQMADTRGYSIGGTVHVVVNNQIGFTTSEPRDARSTRYCTDVASIDGVPVLHICADDPEAVYAAAALAMGYRYRFASDIVLDLVCYRRLGHNEADEPAITQPLMYEKIRSHPPVTRLYAARLQELGELTEDGLQQMEAEYQATLSSGGQISARPSARTRPDEMFDWTPYLDADDMEQVQTGITADRLQTLGAVLCTVADGFVLHPQVERLMEKRHAMLLGDEPMDWGCAELLSYASLMQEGYPIRFTGQDARRGTFAHRHLCLVDQKTGTEQVPLLGVLDTERVRSKVGTGGERQLEKSSALSFYDSYLSEEAVLAFEYGYAATWPTGLVVWEAQFGDFANGAQVVIDQFIVSGEEKWNRLSGLVLLLPHGYEGQGPEHSSARLERFLQQCAAGNIQVCIPSTPAQMFHLMRRQVLRRLRRPLVVMTPKSLLRHPDVVSRHSEVLSGEFRLLIDDAKAKPAQVRRVVACSGRIYYQLAARRDELGAKDIAIVRLEQLYPFPYSELASLLERYKSADTLIWCQEEPVNQGAWHQIMHRFYRTLSRISRQITLMPVTRAGSSSPASGWVKMHRRQEEQLLEQVFATAFVSADAPDSTADTASDTRVPAAESAGRQKRAEQRG